MWLELYFGQILWFSVGRKKQWFPKQLYRNQKQKARRICSYWNAWKTSSFGDRSSHFFISIPQIKHCLTCPGKTMTLRKWVESCESRHPVSGGSALFCCVTLNLIRIHFALLQSSTYLAIQTLLNQWTDPDHWLSLGKCPFLHTE